MGLVRSSVGLPGQINATTLKCEPCLSNKCNDTQIRTLPLIHLSTHPPTNQDMHLGTNRHIHQPITNPSQQATQPDPSTHTLICWMEVEISSTMQISSSIKQVNMSGAMGSQTCRYGHASETVHRKLPCHNKSWRWAHDSLHLPSALEQY